MYCTRTIRAAIAKYIHESSARLNVNFVREL